MPNTTWMEPGSDATQNTGLFTGTSGTVTSDTTVPADTGPRSIKFDSTGSNVIATVNRSGILADVGRRITMYRRFDSLPSSDSNIITFVDAAGAATIARLQLRTTGKLRFVGSTSGADGSATMPTTTFVRISIAYTITSTSVNEFRCWIDGVADATASNLTLAATGTDRLYIGWVTIPGASKVTYARDIYVDDGSDLTDVGNVKVTAKLPTAVNANTWNTTGGTGAVNERPINDANFKQETTTTQLNQNYNLETAGAGDVNISSKTIIGCMAWVRSKISATSGAPTPKITFNGIDYAVTLTTGILYYFKVVDSPTYPSDAAGIGMVSSGAAGDTFLYECGVLVAYLLGTASIPNKLYLTNQAINRSNYY